MNTPNKLTVARIIATPLFMAAMIIPFPFHYLISAVIFITAAITDAVDGKMARKYNLITDFGKFLDPLADKMLTTAAFIGFICIYHENFVICCQMAIMTFIVLFREFMVSSIRLVVVSSGGKVIAANSWGKAKTISQMVGIIFALLAWSFLKDFPFNLPDIVTSIINIAICVLFWASTVLCIISGAIYLNDNKDYVNSSK